jgi:VWFA-related protein
MSPRIRPAIIAMLIFTAGAPKNLGSISKVEQVRAQNQSAPTLQSTTRLVQVTVLVQDKHGNPVSGLTKEDFNVLDEKQPQSIQLFSVETNAVPEHEPAPLPPDVYTNRLAERSAVPKSVTVVLLDALNTEISDQAYSRRQVIKFLSQLQPQDRVGIYTLDYRLNVLHDFTTDSSELIAAVSKYKGEALPGEANGIPHKIDSPPQRGSRSEQALAGFLDLAVDRESNFYLNKRVQITTDAFEAIARHIGSLPGRKNLVWVSGSFPISAGYDSVPTGTPTQFPDQAHFSKDMDRAARALNDANVAVYPVDARGLIASRSAVQPPTRLGNVNRAGPVMTQTGSQQNLATMSLLADRTGGRMFYSNNDLFEAVRLAVDDSRVSYELGYYPEGVKWDGKFHSIHVKVDRPGVRVRARTGYVARPESAITQEEQDAFVAAAAYSPIEASGVRMIVKVGAADIPGARQMNVKVFFDPHDILFRESSEDWSATAELLYAQTDQTGKVLDAPETNVEMKFTHERYLQLLRTGISSTRDVPIHRDATELRVIVHDTTTGAVGSVIIPLKNYFPPSGETH